MIALIVNYTHTPKMSCNENLIEYSICCKEFTPIIVRTSQTSACQIVAQLLCSLQRLDMQEVEKHSQCDIVIVT